MIFLNALIQIVSPFFAEHKVVSIRSLIIIKTLSNHSFKQIKPHSKQNTKKHVMDVSSTLIITNSFLQQSRQYSQLNNMKTVY